MTLFDVQTVVENLRKLLNEFFYTRAFLNNTAGPFKLKLDECNKDRN